MSRWAALFLIGAVVLLLAVVLVLAPAANSEPRHYGNPHTWFSRDAPAADKQRILQGRVKHATDVARFFQNHPRLARTKAGRAAVWQHKRLHRWALQRLREVRRELWLELPDVRDWMVAVRVAQRPYPGSERFLLRTADHEGGRGRWVRYGGGPYYPGYEHTDGVGGWVQYRPSTFRGHYRHALDNLKGRGFRVPERLRDAQSVTAWLSPLAQALAAGWACWAHQTHSHWSASGNGC